VPAPLTDDTTVTATEGPSPWSAMDEPGLREYLVARARERIREVQPDFDLARFDEYLASPDSAPALAGRTVERLMDLAMVELAKGHLDRAEAMVRLVRARARNRNSAFAGSTFMAEIARRRAGDEPAAQEQAIAGALRELPRARFGSSTVIYQLFQTREQLTARVEQVRQQVLSVESASAALFFAQTLPAIVDARDRFLAAITVVRAEHDARPQAPDYRFSTVDMTRERGARPVAMAVWDTGTSPDLFEAVLFTNEAEQANGQDDDGNGQVDDIHGVVADGAAPNTALLYEASAEILEQYTPFLQGIMDLRAGLASTESAQRVLDLLRQAEDVESLTELEHNLDAISEWAHGTHVAGLMVAGNPHARLAVFRSAWAGEARPYFHRGPTDDELAAERANVEAIAEFINRHQIRVVNASLGFSSDYLEEQLSYERDRYQTPAQLRVRADQIHAQRRASWQLVFERCPGTLFVVAAGNSNRDVVEYGDLPADMDRPNVLAIGAVDRWGNWATFTSSSPERVRVFDLGVEAESVIPSGERVPLSGTSMASPNVANLAGKILAVAPSLTPEQVISVIVETGDPIPDPFSGRIANERRALTRARLVARGR